MGRRKKKPGYPPGWFDDIKPPLYGEGGLTGRGRRKSSYAEDRQWLWDKRKRHCHYCSLPLTLARHLNNSMTVDHFIPLSRGGFNKRSNYVPACVRCNNAKGDMLPHEFEQAILDGTVRWPGSGEKRKAEKFAEAVQKAMTDRLTRK